jgi:hypothetical protein
VSWLTLPSTPPSGSKPTPKSNPKPNRVVKVGGVSLNIDADWVAGAVARK